MNPRLLDTQHWTMGDARDFFAMIESRLALGSQWKFEAGFDSAIYEIAEESMGGAGTAADRLGDRLANAAYEWIWEFEEELVRMSFEQGRIDAQVGVSILNFGTGSIIVAE